MKLINENMTRALGRSMLIVKKQSPHILFGTGIAGIVTSTVLACRATLKLESKLDEIQGRVADIKVLAHSRGREDVSPIVKNRDRELATTYIHGAWEITKLYGPSVLIGAASLAALTSSHITMTRRYAAVTAAYGALSQAIDEYRDRVRKEVGENRERELYYGAELEKIPGEDGNPIYAINPVKTSPYARFFDEYNKHWEKSTEHNHFFISCQQNYANHLLRARGHIFLQEVYDMLGFERTPAAQIVGWVMGNGDDFVDFGMFEARNTDFVNGRERSILLDFNVDGIIYDKI